MGCIDEFFQVLHTLVRYEGDTPEIIAGGIRCSRNRYRVLSNGWTNQLGFCGSVTAIRQSQLVDPSDEQTLTFSPRYVRVHTTPIQPVTELSRGWSATLNYELSYLKFASGIVVLSKFSNENIYRDAGVLNTLPHAIQCPSDV